MVPWSVTPPHSFTSHCPHSRLEMNTFLKHQIFTNIFLDNGYLTFVLITKYAIEKYFMHIEISTLVHVTYVNIYLSIQDYL